MSSIMSHVIMCVDYLLFIVILLTSVITNWYQSQVVHDVNCIKWESSLAGGEAMYCVVLWFEGRIVK